MSAISDQERAERSSEAMLRDDHTTKGMGMTIDAVGPGRATLSMVVRKDHLNGHGSCHGGAIFTLAVTPDRASLDPIETASRDEIAALQLNGCAGRCATPTRTCRITRRPSTPAACIPDDLQDLSDLRNFPSP
jgi:hypothetical protein